MVHLCPILLTGPTESVGAALSVALCNKTVTKLTVIVRSVISQHSFVSDFQPHSKLKNNDAKIPL